MELSSRFDANGIGGLQVLWEDSALVFCRGWRDGADGQRQGVLLLFPSSEPPLQSALDRLAHEYALEGELDSAWAAAPLELSHDRGRTALVLEDPGGEPLSGLVGAPMDVERFLRLAVGAADAVAKAHQRGLIHKDIKPAHILVNRAEDAIRLTGFGAASRFARERQAPDPLEVIAGTLAYMAPEQTGRMNRSLDSRSDLYSLGVTFYEMLTGGLPFTASDPMEWVHCHIARQPERPGDRVAGIPDALSSIVMKLLAKTAEQRYQTAAGLEADLRRCLDAWRSSGSIGPFALGAHDASNRLLIAETLYGREREVDALLASFDRVVTQGTPEFVLVSGYSGVGKSSVVSELHKALVSERGLFAAGKFDQYKRDIPYATLAEAFQALVRQILVKSEWEVAQWRRALAEALGAHGQLIVNLVPELEFIVGKQPAIPDLPPQEAQNRFKLVLRRFIGEFARPEHPLALFLDDLQWLDAGTLDLIEDMATQAEAGRLLLVGAYRDNEVGPTHPLLRMRDAIKSAGARVTEIVLAPLALEDVGRLAASALHCEVERAYPLAQLVHERTGGNPFFAIQFLMELAEEGLLAFDPVAPGWRWDVDRIGAKNYTGNVVELMAGKLKRLSAPTQEVLKQFACLGSATEIFILILVQGDRAHTAFREAIHAGLVVQQERAYKFLHDRIQQAAYSLIPADGAADFHLRIGRALLASLTPDQLEEHVFDVANQINRGATSLVEADEIAQAAEINLRAGRKAKASSAYVSACAYLEAGMKLLDNSDWQRRHRLAFSLWLERAECEFLSGNLEEAEGLIEILLQRGASNVDLASVYHLKILLHHVKSENADAVASALACLRLFGVELSAHPTNDEVQAEFRTFWQNLGDRAIGELIDLPLMSDPELLAAMRILSVLSDSTNNFDGNLHSLQLCRAVNLGLQHGVSGPFAHLCSYLARPLTAIFRRYSDAFLVAKLGHDLVERHAFLPYRCKIQDALGIAAVWTQPMATSLDFFRASFRTAVETGDFTYACYAMHHTVALLLLQNESLDLVRREGEIAIDFVRKAKFRDMEDIIVPLQQFTAAMQGRTLSLSTLSDDRFIEEEFEKELVSLLGGRMTAMICWYYFTKAKARFLGGVYAEALAAVDKATTLLWASAGHFPLIDYYYFAALTLASLHDAAQAVETPRWDELLKLHGQLREWAEVNPSSFGDKEALVSAEIARLEGRDMDAMRLYDAAIKLARDNGFVQNEGLADELAARFYAERGFETIAGAYLRNARDCYVRWRADGKVRQLDQLYPHLLASAERRPAAIIGASLQQLDVEAVVRASQALSSEIVLPELIERLMTIAVENAGAERGLLLLPSVDGYLIHAEARAVGDHIEVTMREEPMSGSACPESLVRYVIRTRESVILDDASKSELFSADEYLRARQSKSILCLPLIKQQQLTGILLLENALTSHAFAPARIAVLELVAAQAAISLENTRLYGDLQGTGGESQAPCRLEYNRNLDWGSCWPNSRSQSGVSRNRRL